MSFHRDDQAADVKKSGELEFVDFSEVLFSVPNSRLLVEWLDGRFRIYCVEYEVAIENCLLAEVEWIACTAKVGLKKPTAVWASVLSEGLAMALYENSIWIRVENNLSWRITVSDNLRLHSVEDDDGVRISALPEESPYGLSRYFDGFAEFRETADRVVEDWMDKTPKSPPARRAMVRQCWWTLGANVVTMILDDTPSRLVVPSKRGYVGLWQWDAYFAAIGLSLGDIDLAIEQLDIALRYQKEDGQLPDVVSDRGVLLSSADLPRADRKKMEADCSAVKGRTDIPLTKPPLTGWAFERVMQRCSEAKRASLIEEYYCKVADSQLWWFSENAAAIQGVPAYAHPYSSGLDDSPVFDYDLPVKTPDLLAYLILQEKIVAKWSLENSGGSSYDAQSGAHRLGLLREELQKLWNHERRCFLAQSKTQLITHRTVLSLIAAWSGALKPEQLDAICSDLMDEHRFSTSYGVPSVSKDDAGFRAEIMWRGPIWVNTTYLIAEALEREGHELLAEHLKNQILEFVERAGPVEFLSPVSGRRCTAATTSFSWSAALYLDIACRDYRA
ncbi:MAG: hypothetical protein Q4P06_06525 [Actinomycetaceae bacterium]|nr:hypothetical protein [Actinomycetaceae bacterium]